MGTGKYRLRTASIKDGKYVRISHPWDDQVRKKISDIPILKYDGNCSWVIALEMRYVEKLKECDFIFSKGLTHWWEERKLEKRKRKQLKITKIPRLGGTLYKFQLEGVNFIEHKNGRALIADEMGLGKTIQSLGWVQLHRREVKPVLVICPSFLKVNWKRETEKWTTDMNIQILSGQTPYEITGNFIIINYKILSYWLTELREMKFKTIIIDEAHFIKNSKAKRTKAFKRLSKTSPYLIALTGTPIDNRPIDIFNIVQAIDPSVFPNWMTFVLDFCDAKKDRWGWNTSGSSNKLLLNKVLTESVMLRRKKKDVLKELPPKQFVKVPLEIDNRNEYTKAEVRFVEYLREQFEEIDINNIKKSDEKKLLDYAKGKEMNIEDGLTKELLAKIKKKKLKVAKKNITFMKFEPLKQLAAKGKMRNVIEWIEDFLDSGEKLVVFAHHKKVIQTLIEHFTEAVKIDGSVPLTKRQKVVDRFQEDSSVKLLIGQIVAAGTGITLTAASNVAVIQFPWNPGPLFQAVDRLHRISQTKQVMVWNLVGENTVEEHIINILIKKEKDIGEILDGEKFEETSVLSDLINIYKK